jgi:DNA-directed RNA polymerase specialized sigma24 family protein
VGRQGGIDPEHEALLSDSVGLALLAALETLTPAERLAFVLHNMFAVPFEEIAPILGCSPAATRQFASRARRRVQGATNVPDAHLSR